MACPESSIRDPVPMNWIGTSHWARGHLRRRFIGLRRSFAGRMIPGVERNLHPFLISEPWCGCYRIPCMMKKSYYASLVSKKEHWTCSKVSTGNRLKRMILITISVCHSRESGNPVISYFYGLPPSREWRRFWLFMRPTHLIYLMKKIGGSSNERSSDRGCGTNTDWKL